MNRAIIYFVKLPIIGYNKTRLQGFIPPEDIHHLAVYLLQENYQVIQNFQADVWLYVSPAERKLDIQQLLEISSDRIKGQLDHPHLGRRMSAAMKEVFAKGYQEVALMGCDLVGIDRDLLDEVFTCLQEKDLVLTPTEDGGYGIIASRYHEPAVFDLTAYSHEKVLEETLEKAAAVEMSYGLTRPIDDIDTRDDIAKYLTGDSSAHFFNQGEYNANFLFDQDQKILRIALDSQMHLDDQIVYEYQALKGLESSGVVPKVYECQANTPLLGKGYLIEEYLPGRPLSYQTDLALAADLLAKVHNVNRDNAPHLIVADQPLQVMYQEFQEMFSHYLIWPQKDPVIAEKISKMLRDLDQYDRDQPLQEACIINTELNSHNFLINPGQDSYIIDWEKPLIGEKEQDLAHFLAPTTTLWKTNDLLDKSRVEAFVEAYNQHSHLPVDWDKLITYLHFTCLRGITWCSMAYVQYLQASKIKAADQGSFAVIERFISLPFLEMIEAYIDSLGDLSDDH